jgi:hypothetical protein
VNDSMVKALEKIVGKDKVLQVDTSSSNVGHVDESFQFVPASPDKSNNCGYAVRRGLWLF